MNPANLLHPHSKPHDEEHDHVGSGANTPPTGGISTPRPDLADKRLPGIVNSYFAQVRDSFLAKRESPANTANPAPASLGKELGDTEGPADGAISTQQVSNESQHTKVLGSPSSPSADDYDTPPLLPHEILTPPAQSYPTPPLSNSSSFLALVGDGLRTDMMSTALPSFSTHSKQEHSSSTTSLSSHIRRNTVTSSLSDLCLSKPAVSAHISNPSADVDPPLEHAPSSGLHFASSRLSAGKENRELTLSAARDQNTPPQTPRSGSHESRRGTEIAKAEKSSRSNSGNSNGATVGQLRGQLEVCIEEGRGLRPSVDPYVVCIFQLNEDISGGPEEDAMDTAGDELESNLAKGVAMRRLGSGSGTPMAIPGLRSRQTSSTNIAALRRGSVKPDNHETTAPSWRHTATFDVVGESNEMDVSVYDRHHNEAFLGHVRLPLNLEEFHHQHEAWYRLEPRENESGGTVSGEIRLKIAYHPSGKKTFGPDDFEILKLIGKGTFGQVFQVRKKDTKRIYAMKVLSKKVIVQKKEIQHTIGERNILVRTATTESPFIVGLKFSFQTATDL
nr:serine/threonine-protein kinase sch9 [Quercus suber]